MGDYYLKRWTYFIKFIYNATVESVKINWNTYSANMLSLEQQWDNETETDYPVNAVGMNFGCSKYYPRRDECN